MRPNNTVFMIKKEAPAVQEAKPVAEYVVKERMYQLKDGSYLRLGFSIVVDADKIAAVKEIIEKQTPGRLPDGINMLLGNKTRESLINGTYKREAFARELKKMIDEHVFGPYNRMQKNPEDVVDVRDVLLSDYVTQSG